MLASWNMDESSLSKWRVLVSENSSRELVLKRRDKNVRRNGIDLSKDEIWRVLVGCQVTTQQRSGKNSAASRFLKSSSPALRLRECRRAPSVHNLIESECGAAGLRRAPTMAANLTTIFNGLESGGWSELLDRLRTLERNTTIIKERGVVNHILSSKMFPGLGQKQSRNFIQWLGLSRYEVPLDSRVLKKLAEFGCNFVPKGAALTDEMVYVFVQSAIQQIAKALDMYPCELDAYIFSSFEDKEEEDEDGNDA